MGMRTLHKGAKVADAAFPNASFPAQLEADGYEGFCCYLSSPTTNGKNWNAQRLEWFKHFGCGMFCEQYETIVFTGYSAANLTLGRQCEAMANSFGVPLEAPMWFAVDTSPFGHFNEIAASFQAYQDTNRRPLAVYGGSQLIDFLIDEGLVKYGHVPAALSWSATNASLDGVTVFSYNGGRSRWYLTPHANMLQHPSIAYAGSRIDPNDVLRDTPFWVPAAEDKDPVPPPAPEPTPPPTPIPPNPTPGDGMPYILQCTDAWAAFLSPTWPAYELNWVGGPERKNAYTALGVPVMNVTVEQLKYCVLVGKMPVGDMRTWSAADFWDVIGSGVKGDKGDPGDVPHGTFQATVTL